MVGLQPICLLYPTTYLDPIGFLSVIRACLPLNIWRALLVIFSVVRILRICGRVEKLDRDFPPYNHYFPSLSGIDDHLYRVFILTTILKNMNLIKKKRVGQKSVIR